MDIHLTSSLSIHNLMVTFTSHTIACGQIVKGVILMHALAGVMTDTRLGDKALRSRCLAYELLTFSFFTVGNASWLGMVVFVFIIILLSSERAINDIPTIFFFSIEIIGITTSYVAISTEGAPRLYTAVRIVALATLIPRNTSLSRLTFVLAQRHGQDILNLVFHGHLFSESSLL